MNRYMYTSVAIVAQAWIIKIRELELEQPHLETENSFAPARPVPAKVGTRCAEYDEEFQPPASLLERRGPRMERRMNVAMRK